MKIEEDGALLLTLFLSQTNNTDTFCARQPWIPRKVTACCEPYLLKLILV